MARGNRCSDRCMSLFAFVVGHFHLWQYAPAFRPGKDVPQNELVVEGLGKIDTVVFDKRVRSR